MSDKSELLEALNQVLDGRLGTMTSVVNEATRSAASAAGAAMEVRGQLAGVKAGLQRLEDAQQRTADRLTSHGEQLAAIKRTCSDRGAWCGQRFEEAARDLQSTWASVDRAWRDATRGLHARAKRTSEEIDRVRDEAAAERAELARKLSDVREDTGVVHIAQVEERAKRRARWGLLAKIAAAAVALGGLVAAIVQAVWR